jgi:hypothetical protein
MLQMDLPHLNVLTKIDTLSNYAPLAFNLDFYTEVQDLNYLIPHLEAESSITKTFRGLNEAIAELVESFGLVGFETLAIEDKPSMISLLRAVDRAGGYAFGGAEGANDTVWQMAVREGGGGTIMDVRDVQERWIDSKDVYDQEERKQWEAEGKAAREEAENSKAGDGADDSDDEMMMDLPAELSVKVRRKPAT